MPLKVGVLMGGASSEREVSIGTGKAVMKACNELGYATTDFFFKKNFKKLLDALKKQDIIFNALHGGVGENGKIQSWMNAHNIKYTGSGPKASALCMDKTKSKAVAKSLGVKTPEWELIDNLSIKPKIQLPYVIKPNAEGSTMGISIIANESHTQRAMQNAFKYGKHVIVEKYIKGRELTIPIIGKNILPIVEVIPSNDFYDYECKYNKGMSQYVCPAKLSKKIEKKIRSNTELLFHKLGCEIYGRADYILDDLDTPYFLEMNTLPGLTETSLVPKSANKRDLPFNDLIKIIIELSL